jgi:hypothetical protein
MGAELESSARHLQEASTLMQALPQDPVAAAAGASCYLRLLGLVACGHCWLRMAIAAADTSGAEGANFYLGKMKTARFYMAHMLPESRQLLSSIRADPSLVTDVAAEELS